MCPIGRFNNNRTTAILSSGTSIFSKKLRIQFEDH